MPGFLLHVGATVICAHGGQAQPTVPNPRVLRDGSADRHMPALTSSPAARSPPPGANGPCVTAQWLTGPRASLERPAAAAARQPGDLRADRHAADDHGDADARHRNVSHEHRFSVPLRRRGRTAATDDGDHVRDMIEQLLFTNPGERVNRPDFGSGLLQMVLRPTAPSSRRHCSSRRRRRCSATSAT